MCVMPEIRFNQNPTALWSNSTEYEGKLFQSIIRSLNEDTVHRQKDIEASVVFLTSFLLFITLSQSWFPANCELHTVGEIYLETSARYQL